MKKAEIPALTEAGESAGPLQEQIYLLLKGMIEAGQIKSGERLLEAELVRAFGISRSPARRALSRLSDDGLVEELAGRGYRVAGAGDDEDGGLAALEPVAISAPRQWERMYKEVEQELFVRTLFGSMRVNEMRLAQHFNVSRTVTRDLLARMHGVGIIAKDSAGHWIAERVTPDRIRHLYEMRCLLEPAALLQAAAAVPRPVLERMRDHIVAARRTTPMDSALFDRAEADMHIDLLGHCPNDEILRALKRTHLLFGPTRYLFDPFLGIPIELIEAALREHLAIVDRLLAGEAERAAEGLRAHLEDAVSRWLRRFDVTARVKPQPLPPYLAAV